MIAREDLRPLVHGGTGLCALLLGFMPRWMDLVGAGLGMLAGWVVMPLTSVDARLRRPGEPFFGGLRTYPLAVLFLILFLPETYAAAAWGVFAMGDAAASLVGRHVPSPRLFGHKKASVAGTTALFVVGTLAAFGLAAVARAAGGGPPVSIGAAAVAAAAGCVADFLPIPPDDNLPIAGAAGLALAAMGGLLG